MEISGPLGSSQCRSGLATREPESQVQGLGEGCIVVCDTEVRFQASNRLGKYSTTAYIPGCFDFL